MFWPLKGYKRITRHYTCTIPRHRVSCSPHTNSFGLLIQVKRSPGKAVYCKIQVKNSRKKLNLREVLWVTQGKNLNFTKTNLKPEKFSWSTSFYAIFVHKYFQILPISHNFCQKYRKFSKIDKKLPLKNLKLKKNPENSSKKLKTQAKNSGSGRHLPLSSAQVVL